MTQESRVPWLGPIVYWVSLFIALLVAVVTSTEGSQFWFRSSAAWATFVALASWGLYVYLSRRDVFRQRSEEAGRMVEREIADFIDSENDADL